MDFRHFKHFESSQMTINSILEKTKNVRVVAVSKYVGIGEIQALSKYGFTEFGENKVQDLARKCEALRGQNLSWHFIGTLQSNKINLLLRQKPILWQSCNSLALAKAVNQRLSYTLDTLIEINSANEASKSGLNADEAVDAYLQIQQECRNLRLCGVMSIGAHSENELEIAKSFEKTHKIYENLQKHGAKLCSMGMSGDFELAIKCGANMVRLGSVLFGALKNGV